MFTHRRPYILTYFALSLLALLATLLTDGVTQRVAYGATAVLLTLPMFHRLRQAMRPHPHRTARLVGESASTVQQFALVALLGTGLDIIPASNAVLYSLFILLAASILVTLFAETLLKERSVTRGDDRKEP